MIPGFGRELPDAVLVRGIAGGSFEQVTQAPRRAACAARARRAGLQRRARDRAQRRQVDDQPAAARGRRSPTPPTWAIESAAQAQRVVMRESAAGHALVLKPLFGSQGKGLQRVGAVDGVHHALPPLERRLRRRSPTCSASCRRSTAPGFDWRVLVVGGRARHRDAPRQRALGAQRRAGRALRRRRADAASSRAWPRHAARALDLDYAGVDLMPAADAARRAAGDRGQRRRRLARACSA